MKCYNESMANHALLMVNSTFFRTNGS